MNEKVQYACRLLSRREYAVEELRRRLVAKWPGEEGIGEAIERLVQEGLVSDRRFAESFVRARTRKFQGPLKIRAELHKRGVPEHEVEAAVQSPDSGWTALAADWLERQGLALDDYGGRATAYRRLVNRGFSHNQAMTAIEQLRHDHRPDIQV